jgi:integrase/recombinase XerD
MYANNGRKLKPELIPDKVSPHTLRHSKAMHLLQAGVNLVYIRDILGHVSIQTTELYARADSKQKREALEAAYINVIPNLGTEGAWEKSSQLKAWLKNLSK